jgi:NADH oxidase (H2O2-forming)
MVRKIVVIGSGAAGMTAASTARKIDPQAEITVVTEDEHIAYSPCVIPWVLEGLTDWESIIMHDPRYYREERGIEVSTCSKVEAVDMAKKTLSVQGREIPYDSLVVATGGTVFVPPISGARLRNVFVVRTINDGKAIQKALPEVRNVAVIGAGVIGLEIALSLRRAAKNVTVVEMMDQVIPRIFDKDMADPVQAYLEGQGIRFIMGAPIQSVLGAEKVEGVLAGEESVPCEMMVFATGVRANLEVPRMLELDIGSLGAVTVSPSMQPYRKGRLVPDVFLAGDVVQCQSAVAPGPTMSQLGSSAVRQGIVAGSNAAGGYATHGPVASPWVSVIGDVQVGGTGLSESLSSWYGLRPVCGRARGQSRARYYPGGSPFTVKLLVDPSSHLILGAQMMAGEELTGRINWLTAAITERVSIDDLVCRFENAYCPPTSMVRDVVLAAADDALQQLKRLTC